VWLTVESKPRACCTASGKTIRVLCTRVSLGRRQRPWMAGLGKGWVTPANQHVASVAKHEFTKRSHGSMLAKVVDGTHDPRFNV